MHCDKVKVQISDMVMLCKRRRTETHLKYAPCAFENMAIRCRLNVAIIGSDHYFCFLLEKTEDERKNSFQWVQGKALDEVALYATFGPKHVTDYKISP
jgi:hypothetical protein